MASRLGNVSVSSLVKSAISANNHQLDYQDSLAAYNYQLSDKSAEAYQQYADYLSKRAATYTDPTRLLGFTKAQDSAWKGYKSSEIQKASLAVNYGQGSLYDKRNTLDSLWQQAKSIGDDATAQSLELQRSSLDIQIQNQEARSSGGSGGGGGSSSTANYKGLTNNIKELGMLKNHINAQLTSGQISPITYQDKMSDTSLAMRGEYLRAFGIQEDPQHPLSASQVVDALNAKLHDENLAANLGITDSELHTLTNDVNNYINGDYKNFNEYTKQEAANGQNNKYLQWDPNTHTFTAKEGKQGEQTLLGMGPDGKATTQAGIELGVQGGNYLYDRKLGTRPGDDQSTVGLPYSTGKDGVRTTIDPYTGAKMYISPDGQFRSLNPNEIHAYIAQTDPKTAAKFGYTTDANGGSSAALPGQDGKMAKSTVGFWDKANAATDVMRENIIGTADAAVHHAVNGFNQFAGNVTNFVTNTLSNKNTLDIKAAQLKAEQAKQAQAAQQAAALAAQNQAFQAAQAAQRAQPVSRASNAYIANAPTNNQIYYNSGASPVAAFNAATNGGHPTSDSQIAAGLGAAAGYNPNWLNNPKF